MEAESGYDRKHGAHLVRLLRMGIEVLSTGKFNVDRSQIDAEELRAIRNGAWSFEQLVAYADEMDDKIQSFPKDQMKVPHSADIAVMDAFLMRLMEKVSK